MICDGCLNNDGKCTMEKIDICKAYMSYINHEEDCEENEEE